MGSDTNGATSNEVDPEDNRDSLFAFDVKEAHYPLFCLADVPNEYFDAIDHNLQPNTAWLAVSSSAPSLPQILSEISSHLEERPNPYPMPFLDFTIPELYSFFRTHLRQPRDSARPHPFTHFTFLAVDTECFQPSSPPTERPNYTILLCSDAPDFHESETEVRLKIMRLPLVDALENLCGIEILTMTPSEVDRSCLQDPDSDSAIVRLMPPAIFFPLEPFTNPRDQEYCVATPADARARKIEGLAVALVGGWKEGEGWPDDRRRMIDFWPDGTTLEHSYDGLSEGFE